LSCWRSHRVDGSALIPKSLLGHYSALKVSRQSWRMTCPLWGAGRWHFGFQAFRAQNRFFASHQKD
jgi:hypothetical protein